MSMKTDVQWEEGGGKRWEDQKSVGGSLFGEPAELSVGVRTCECHEDSRGQCGCP